MDRIIKALSQGWQLSYIDNSEYKKLKDKNITTVSKAKKLGNAMPASVPGDFLSELEKAGILPDYTYGNNSWEYQKYEYTHVFYFTEFELREKPSEDMYFDFEGLDTNAEIYLGGRLIGKTDNMFIPHRIKANGLKKGKNELVIHFIPVMLDRGPQLSMMNNTLFYNFESLYTRKAAHSYGWDIMPRILSCGIWKDVFLCEKARAGITEFYLFTLRTNPEENTARVRIYFALDVSDDNPREYRLTVDGVCGESRFHTECSPHSTEYTRLGFGIENCKLWWPRDFGEQNLYDVEVKLWRGNTLCDEKKLRVGIRTAELERTDTVKDGNGEFAFRINGKKVFCRGTNWVPLSPFHCEDEARYPKALDLLYDVGCNMVRVWGGSVYPSDTFYNFCDEKGIMVWQDFAMACAVYPQDELFCGKIAEEAEYIVKALRSHPSLVLWAGDNECDCTCQSWTGYRRDPNENVLTRKIIPEIIRRHDYVRAYLPSSPYISPDAHTLDLPTPEAHLWGDRIWFKSDYYKESPCLFASEIGYIGLPGKNSLEKFIGKDMLYPTTDEHGQPNVHWLAHTTEAQEDGELSYKYRFFLPRKEVMQLFGKLPDNLDDYIVETQISQAEAYKYFIESFRTKKWRKTGILWWNLIDGWPQISDAVVDSYYNKKPAYYYIKRVQTPVALMFDEPADGKLTLYGVNDTQTDAEVSFKVTRVGKDDIEAKGKITLSANDIQALGKVLAPDEYGMYLIEWEYNGKTYKNHYVTGMINMNAKKYLADIAACGFDDEMIFG